MTFRGLRAGAAGVYRDMKRGGVAPTMYIYDKLISACKAGGAARQVRAA